MWDLGGSLGTGIERGSSREGSAVALSPLFAELTLRAYSSEQPEWMYGGSLRAELTGLGAVGLVPRVELNPLPGPLSLRPGLGLALYFIPMALIGPELSFAVRVPLTREWGLQAMGFLAVFLLGNNLPEDSTLVQLGGSFGVSWMF